MSAQFVAYHKQFKYLLKGANLDESTRKMPLKLVRASGAPRSRHVNAPPPREVRQVIAISYPQLRGIWGPPSIARIKYPISY